MGSAACTPIRLTFFLLPITAVLFARHLIPPAVSITSSSRSPSATRIRCPFCSFASASFHDNEIRAGDPFPAATVKPSSVVMTTSSPLFMVTLPSFSTMPVRISGPLVSNIIATGIPNSLEIRLTRSTVARCSSFVPWEKLRRATFIPASTRSRTTESSNDAGPKEHTIFVFLFFIKLYPSV